MFLVLMHCEVWCECKFVDDRAAPGREKIIRGKVAAQQLYKMTEEAAGNNKNADMPLLGTLRQFGWLLDAEQKQNVDKWVKIGAAQVRAGMSQKMLTAGAGSPAGAAGAGKPEAPAKTGSGSSSSSTAVALPRSLMPAATATTPKEKEAQAAKKKTNQATLSGLFGKKALLQ
jgi:hypothetical protein